MLKVMNPAIGMQGWAIFYSIQVSVKLKNTELGFKTAHEKT